MCRTVEDARDFVMRYCILSRRVFLRSKICGWHLISINPLNEGALADIRNLSRCADGQQNSPLNFRQRRHHWGYLVYGFWNPSNGHTWNDDRVVALQDGCPANDATDQWTLAQMFGD